MQGEVQEEAANVVGNDFLGGDVSDSDEDIPAPPVPVVEKVPPPPMPMLAATTRRVLKQPREVFVKVHDAGYITYYSQGGVRYFVAHCRNVAAHGQNCKLTRTAQGVDEMESGGQQEFKRKMTPKQTGQGRPLGLLVAWLLQGAAKSCDCE